MASPSSHSVQAGTPWAFYDDLLYKVTAGFNLFLKGLFKAQPPNNYHWADDMKESELIITDQSPINLEVVEKRPAIVTIRGHAQWANLGMNQMENYDFRTGKSTHLDLISSTMTFACVSRSGVEAQRLAWFIFVMIPLFKGHLQRSIQGLHNIGNNMTLSGETPAGTMVQGSSSPEWKMVQVVAPLSMSFKSSIEPMDKIFIERLTASITTVALEGQGGTDPPQQPLLIDKEC